MQVYSVIVFSRKSSNGNKTLQKTQLTASKTEKVSERVYDLSKHAALTSKWEGFLSLFCRCLFGRALLTLVTTT